MADQRSMPWFQSMAIPCRGMFSLSFGVLLILFISSGYARGDMICMVARPVSAKCSPYLVLESGKIFVSDRQFNLKGQYDACYHHESVRIRGKLKRYLNEHEEILELLATEIKRDNRITDTFPRTIGTIVISNKSLRGYFFDAWTSLGNQGLQGQAQQIMAVRCVRGKQDDDFFGRANSLIKPSFFIDGAHAEARNGLLSPAQCSQYLQRRIAMATHNETYLGCEIKITEEGHLSINSKQIDYEYDATAKKWSTRYLPYTLYDSLLEMARAVVANTAEFQIPST